MKRKEIKQTKNVTDRGVTKNGHPVIFNYEKTDGEKVMACNVSLFEDEESDDIIASGEVNLENGLNIFCHKPLQGKVLASIAEVLQEVEVVFELNK